jgi:hypothetical protein
MVKLSMALNFMGELYRGRREVAAQKSKFPKGSDQYSFMRLAAGLHFPLTDHSTTRAGKNNSKGLSGDASNPKRW